MGKTQGRGAQSGPAQVAEARPLLPAAPRLWLRCRVRTHPLPGGMTPHTVSKKQTLEPNLLGFPLVPWFSHPVNGVIGVSNTEGCREG